MDNFDAIKQLENGFMCSDTYERLPIADKVAIRKAVTALRNVSRGYQLHEIDNGMPIRYFTTGKINCHKDMSGGAYVTVDDRAVFHVTYGGENCRGQRGEVIVYDNSVDKDTLNVVIAPLLRGNGMLIHDAFDLSEHTDMRRAGY